MRRRMVENVKSFGGRDQAIRIRETFQNAPAEHETEMPWDWPHSLRLVGEAYAVMYRSNKWKKNKTEYESYKHICESRKPWKLYAVPGFVIEHQRGGVIPFYGESFETPLSQMPASFAELANFLGIQCRLLEKRGGRVVMPTGDERLVEIQLARAKLAAGKTKNGKTFLTVYIESEGPKLIIFGTELDVEKDGIVG